MEDAVFRLRSRIFEKLYELPRSVYATADQSDLHTVIVQDTARVKQMSNVLISVFLPRLVSVLVFAAVLFWLNWLLALVMTLVVPFMLVGNHVVSKRVRERIHLFHRSFEQFARGVNFVLRAMDLTRLQAHEEEEHVRQIGTLVALRRHESSMALASATHSQLQEGFVAVSAILILVIGGATVSQGMTTLGSFFAFYFTASLLNMNARTAFHAIPDILAGHESLRSLFGLLHRRETRPYAGKRSFNFEGSIRFERVGFGYGETSVLTRIDLTIRPAARISICGANGAGKSTLLYLLLGFYRPDRGSIHADGVPYDELDMRCLRSRIGVVTQDPFFFRGTVRENIAYGSVTSSDADIVWASRLALAHDFVEDLPAKYDTLVGEDAVFLSGGQRQRLAIARALLRKPKILLFDEPTNHLDPGAIGQLLMTLEQLPGRPAVVTISHDQHVLRDATERYELRDGVLAANPRDRATRA